ncbi:MAG: hypothetical protein CL840_16620 [Crocinitomicaceae bacterium]|nr:hypothetical protein [Crocinitomicaceae bacterium]|tara:strand:+ start:15197 stop:17500 length:2304 start_codon:yes stop_codon:yes gene_type:complete
MRFAIIILFLFNAFVQSKAQLTPVFEWRDHLTYSKVTRVAYANNKVYASGNSGMFFVDLEDNSVNRISTINGLSDIVTTSLGTSNHNQSVYVGYEDGTIDIIENKTILTIPDIKRSNIIGNKQVNHFNFTIDNVCYISTGFGVVKFNIANKEVSETFRIGKNGSLIFVNSTFISGDTLYAATQKGLYKGGLSSFLYDPDNWQKVDSFPRADSNLSAGFEFGGKIHVNVNNIAFQGDTVYTLDSGKWVVNSTLSGEDNNTFEIKNNELLVANSTSFEVWDTSWKKVRREFQSNGDPIAPKAATYGPGDEIWFGDFTQGLIQNLGPFSNREYVIDGPVSNRAFRLNAFGGNVYVCGGAHSDVQVRLGFPGEVSKFNNENWTLYDRESIIGFDTLTDIIAVSENPNNSKQFAVGSMGGGLIIFNNNQVQNIYGFANSPLTGIADIATYVTGVDYDKNGTLWISNSISKQPIHALTQSGSWVSFNIGDQSTERQSNQVIATDWGHIWYIIPSVGIGVLDYNSTLGTNADDRYLELLTAAGSGALASSEVTRMAVDRDGHIWVGSNVGINVFYNAATILNRSDVDSKEIFIDQDGQTQILLKDQFVTDIFIDVANRKWISTRGNGVYLMSSDGTKEVRHFTTENSPLYTDDVNSVSVDEKTGEVFIATEKGLISFRETATASSDFSSMYAFPNPVLPSYDGIIAISGVADQATIIITDIAGNKVYETISEGGQATWNGKNLNGDPVATGIYLIYGASEDGSLHGATKLLIEN